MTRLALVALRNARTATAAVRSGAMHRIAVPSALGASRAAPVMRSRAFATERDGNVSLKDPAEEEAQRLLEQGTVALEVGDLEKAKEDYRMSAKVHENASAFYNLGICEYQDRNLEGAIQAWNEAIRIAPNSPDAHTNLASAYIMSKPSRPDLATEHLRTAASQSPDDPEIHYNLGAVLEACEQLQEALQAYQRAYDGGIERAMQNIRNCMAKLTAARLKVEEDKTKESQGASPQEGAGKE